jgi:hypothetical protein
VKKPITAPIKMGLRQLSKNAGRVTSDRSGTYNCAAPRRPWFQPYCWNTSITDVPPRKIMAHANPIQADKAVTIGSVTRNSAKCRSVSNCTDTGRVATYSAVGPRS